MSAHTTMILLVALLVITTGGVMVFYQITSDVQQVPTMMRGSQEVTDELVLVNVVGTNISEEDTYKYVQIQVQYDGEERLNLNDTFIQLRTPTSTADLWYRDGTTERDPDSGFYTG